MCVYDFNSGDFGDSIKVYYTKEGGIAVWLGCMKKGFLMPK